jgi:sugar (pentulose or hexulose) kinase
VLFYPNHIETPSAWIGEGSPAEMALAVLEGIGYALRQLIFDELGGELDLQKLILIGGGSRSDFWLQLLADILGIVIQRGDGDSLAGAAQLAIPGVTPASHSKRKDWIPMDARTKVFQDIYQKWRNSEKSGQ